MGSSRLAFGTSVGWGVIIEKIEKVEKLERVEQAEQVENGEKVQKAGKVEKVQKVENVEGRQFVPRPHFYNTGRGREPLSPTTWS